MAVLKIHDGTSYVVAAGIPASGDTLPIVDTTPLVKGSADATKLFRVEIDSIATATTRVLTMADQNVDLTPNTGTFPSVAHSHGDSEISSLPLTGDVTTIGSATTIGAKKVTLSMLADSTDGELITWDSLGVAAAVAVGTATQVLTSNGPGAAPTFQAASGGSSLPVVDTTSIAEGSVDATKEVRFECDGITTGTVRVLTMADQNVDLTPDTGTFPAVSHTHLEADITDLKSYLLNLVEDTTPQLGGSLDLNSLNRFFIDSNGNNVLLLTGLTSAINYFRISNAGIGNDPAMQAGGLDPNVSLDFQSKGTGIIKIDGIEAVSISGTQTLTNKSIVATQLTGTVTIANGGTAASTAQAAIDTLTAVSGATNEHVLTKDTATGNAIFKVASGGGGGDLLDDAKRSFGTAPDANIEWRTIGANDHLSIRTGVGTAAQSGYILIEALGDTVDPGGTTTNPTLRIYDADSLQYLEMFNDGTNAVIRGDANMMHVGTPGDIQLGDDSIKTMFPQTDKMIHLGKTGNKFADAHLSGDVNVVAGTGTTSFRTTGILKSDIGSVLTSTGSEQVLKAFTLSANSMSVVNSALRITAWGRFAANANQKEVRLRIEDSVTDTTIFAMNFTTTKTAATNDGMWELTAIVVNDATDFQFANSKISLSNPSSAATPVSLTICDSNTTLGLKTADQWIVRINGNGVAASDIACDGLVVEFIPADAN